MCVIEDLYVPEEKAPADAYKLNLNSSSSTPINKNLQAYHKLSYTLKTKHHSTLTLI